MENTQHSSQQRGEEEGPSSPSSSFFGRKGRTFFSLLDLCVERIKKEPWRCLENRSSLVASIPEELRQLILTRTLGSSSSYQRRRYSDKEPLPLRAFLVEGLQSLCLLNAQWVDDSYFATTVAERSCSNLRCLTIKQCLRLSDQTLRAVADGCPKLQELTISGCRGVTDEGVSYLAARCPMITVFLMNGCHRLTSNSLIQIAEHCRNLRVLGVARCNKVMEGLYAIAAACPELRWLDAHLLRAVDDAFIISLVRQCRNLKRLYLSQCKKITDKSMIELANHLSDLEELYLGGCTQLTDHSIVPLMKVCGSIEELNLGACSITDNSLLALSEHCKAPSLRVLILDNVTKTSGHDGLIQVAETFNTHLRKLKLKGVNPSPAAIRAIAKHCTNLRGLLYYHLSLFHLFVLNWSLLTKYADLKLSEAYRLDDACLMEVIQSLGSSLRGLGLDNCFRLSDASVAQIPSFCPRLRSLNLSNGNGQTRTITGATVESFARCDHTALQKLTLERCHDIDDDCLELLVARCEGLVYLNVAFTDVTDSGICNIIKSRSNLRKLDVKGTSVTDEVGECLLSIAKTEEEGTTCNLRYVAGLRATHVSQEMWTRLHQETSFVLI
ncbi:hypothetical protein QOT17_007290 [Balamuthia mandrillaris]